MLVYVTCECFVMQMLYVCNLCASCGSSTVNAGRGCKRRPYGRGILQSRSHNCLVSSHECLLLFTPSCCSECFMIRKGLCACTVKLWMCVLYVSFGSKVRPRIFGCVAMGSALLFILRSRLFVYSAGSGVNRVQVVLFEFSMRLFCFVQEFLNVGMVVCISWLHSCLCV